MTGIPLLMLAIVVIAGICHEVGRRQSKRPPAPRCYQRVVGQAYEAMRAEPLPSAKARTVASPSDDGLAAGQSPPRLT